MRLRGGERVNKDFNKVNLSPRRAIFFWVYSRPPKMELRRRDIFIDI